MVFLLSPRGFEHEDALCATWWVCSNNAFVLAMFALVTLAFSGEPCEDKPTTGKYTCADMANKLGLCEKSEHVRALCPKSCNACKSGDETAATTQSTTKGSAEIELLKNELMR